MPFPYSYISLSTSPLYHFDFYLCTSWPVFIFFSFPSPLTYPPLVAPIPYSRICPNTASLTLCLTLSSPPLPLPCLWPFALCTSNGWGVIHWLICWQPVWQGISFVSLPTMLLLSVCVSERVRKREKRESLWMWVCLYAHEIYLYNFAYMLTCVIGCK